MRFKKRKMKTGSVETYASCGCTCTCNVCRCPSDPHPPQYGVFMTSPIERTTEQNGRHNALTK